MKNLIIILSFFVFILPNTNAQDVKAKKILDQVSLKTRNYKTMKVDFSVTMENKASKIKEVRGGVVYLKGKKYKASYMKTDVYCDSKTIWTHSIEDEEVNISNVENREKEGSIFDPTKLLTIYEKGFKHKYIGLANNLYEIDLYPINAKKKAFYSIKLLADKTKMQISTIKYFGKDGNNYLVEIKGLTPNIQIADNVFVFDKKKYPNVEVIDLR